MRPEVLRVLFCCTGVGIVNRGIETFFREAFDGLRNLDGIEGQLIKGNGESLAEEPVVWTLRRTGRIASAIGALARRNGYVVEQWSSFLPIAHQVRRFRPGIIFYSDANLGFLLYRLRRQVGVPYRLLFSNGGPNHPPFIRTDFVHQVAPLYHQEAIAAGEPPAKHVLVPYGIRVPHVSPSEDMSSRAALRQRLGLPAYRPIVISVGWIARSHKRMDYVIEELARLPAPRPFLLLLGSMTEESREVVQLGHELLGVENFLARTVAPREVDDYYRAADCFVLASLQEGFGRVYAEAQMHGLPVVAHRHPVTEYVLGEDAVLADLSRSGTLGPLINDALRSGKAPGLAARRWASVRDRFSWEALRPAYRDMFLHCGDGGALTPARPNG